MDLVLNRAEVWVAKGGDKSRPVLVLTRPEVIGFRSLVTVAEVTTSIRGIRAEVPFDVQEAGLNEQSVINCDGLYTVPRSTLTERVGKVNDIVMDEVCRAVQYALGC